MTQPLPLSLLTRYFNRYPLLLFWCWLLLHFFEPFCCTFFLTNTPIEKRVVSLSKDKFRGFNALIHLCLKERPAHITMRHSGFAEHTHLQVLVVCLLSQTQLYHNLYQSVGQSGFITLSCLSQKGMVIKMDENRLARKQVWTAIGKVFRFLFGSCLGFAANLFQLFTNKTVSELNITFWWLVPSRFWPSSVWAASAFIVFLILCLIVNFLLKDIRFYYRTAIPVVILICGVASVFLVTVFAVLPFQGFWRTAPVIILAGLTLFNIAGLVFPGYKIIWRYFTWLFSGEVGDNTDSESGDTA